MKKFALIIVLPAFLNCAHHVSTQCLTNKIESEITSGKPVLQVGNTTIHEGQINVLMEIMPGFRANWDNTEDRKKIVSQLIEQELFYQKAKELDLLSQNERLQKNLWLQSRNYQAGTYLLQEVDKRARVQYEKDKDELFSQIEIKDIVYLYQNTGTENLDDQKKIALKKAVDLRKKINAKNFSEMAAKETDNPIAKANGGTLGNISLIDQRVKFLGWRPLVIEAYKLKKGKISQPIETAEGVHIIQVVGNKQTQPFEDVQPYLRTQLEAQVKKDLLDQMLKDTQVQYLDPALKPDLTPKP